ncbi:alkaline phosphatase [Halomonas campisalis]|uniref:Alkaline phosphatase n=1 Tax=Billgrantia campisalis TaxID=74661 RepID=A0ABS9P6X6_9GAMM|nr:alkaline phosphatase [Halomonas campisalis]MCG6657522.1 alkaline phosphatase [Halomonas campisalis]MDR5863131.1 alkaline phosphatase [Halomonas campisalis]
MLRLLIGAALLNVALLLPLWLRFGELSPRWLALEALLLAALFALLPARGPASWLRWPALAAVALALLAGLGDAATHQALGRSLNLYLDLPLLRSVYHLLAGNLGTPLAVLALLLAVVALVGLLWGLWRGLAALQGRARRGAALGLALLLVVGSGALLAAELNQARLVPVARAPLVDTLRFQGQQLIETHRARRDFTARLADAPGPVRELSGLAGRDVLLVFVESYGVSAVNDERYAEVILPRLDDMAARLETAGLAVVSGTLDAPIRGGQSWLAHASTLSGLWIDSQLWYRLMLASERPTLVDDFRASGHRTLTVMPAITLAWPEGEAYGFDEIHAAADIDYAGPPLNWVTMPDQFTLYYFERHIRQPAAAPLFAQIALISSHAPWTPILPVLDDWDEVGDGSVFQRWADAGDPPEVLWQDLERVREHYALSVDYSLNASMRWIEDFLGDDSLLILLGDHQAAPLITGDDASGGVPVHVISGDPALLAPFEARGFVPGMLPPEREEHPGMDRLRAWLHEDFGG